MPDTPSALQSREIMLKRQNELAPKTTPKPIKTVPSTPRRHPIPTHSPRNNRKELADKYRPPVPVKVRPDKSPITPKADTVRSTGANKTRTPGTSPASMTSRARTPPAPCTKGAIRKPPISSRKNSPARLIRPIPIPPDSPYANPITPKQKRPTTVRVFEYKRTAGQRKDFRPDYPAQLAIEDNPRLRTQSPQKKIIKFPSEIVTQMDEERPQRMVKSSVDICSLFDDSETISPEHIGNLPEDTMVDIEMRPSEDTREIAINDLTISKSGSVSSSCAKLVIKTPCNEIATLRPETSVTPLGNPEVLARTRKSISSLLRLAGITDEDLQQFSSPPSTKEQLTPDEAMVTALKHLITKSNKIISESSISAAMSMMHEKCSKVEPNLLVPEKKLRISSSPEDLMTTDDPLEFAMPQPKNSDSSITKISKGTSIPSMAKEARALELLRFEPRKQVSDKGIQNSCSPYGPLAMNYAKPGFRSPDIIHQRQTEMVKNVASQIRKLERRPSPLIKCKSPAISRIPMRTPIPARSRSPSRAPTHTRSPLGMYDAELPPINRPHSHAVRSTASRSLSPRHQATRIVAQKAPLSKSLHVTSRSISPISVSRIPLVNTKSSSPISIKKSNSPIAKKKSLSPLAKKKSISPLPKKKSVSPPNTKSSHRSNSPTTIRSSSPTKHQVTHSNVRKTESKHQPHRTESKSPERLYNRKRYTTRSPSASGKSTDTVVAPSDRPSSPRQSRKDVASRSSTCKKMSSFTKKYQPSKHSDLAAKSKHTMSRPSSPKRVDSGLNRLRSNASKDGRSPRNSSPLARTKSIYRRPSRSSSKISLKPILKSSNILDQMSGSSPISPCAKNSKPKQTDIRVKEESIQANLNHSKVLVIDSKRHRVEVYTKDSNENISVDDVSNTNEPKELYPNPTAVDECKFDTNTKTSDIEISDKQTVDINCENQIKCTKYEEALAFLKKHKMEHLAETELDDLKDEEESVCPMITTTSSKPSEDKIEYSPNLLPNLDVIVTSNNSSICSNLNKFKKDTFPDNGVTITEVKSDELSLKKNDDYFGLSKGIIKIKKDEMQPPKPIQIITEKDIISEFDTCGSPIEDKKVLQLDSSDLVKSSKEDFDHDEAKLEEIRKSIVRIITNSGSENTTRHYTDNDLSEFECPIDLDHPPSSKLPLLIVNQSRVTSQAGTNANTPNNSTPRSARSKSNTPGGTTPRLIRSRHTTPSNAITKTVMSKSNTPGFLTPNSIKSNGKILENNNTTSVKSKQNTPYTGTPTSATTDSRTAYGVTPTSVKSKTSIPDATTPVSRREKPITPRAMTPTSVRSQMITPKIGSSIMVKSRVNTPDALALTSKNSKTNSVVATIPTSVKTKSMTPRLLTPTNVRSKINIPECLPLMPPIKPATPNTGTPKSNVLESIIPNSMKSNIPDIITPITNKLNSEATGIVTPMSLKSRTKTPDFMAQMLTKSNSNTDRVVTPIPLSARSKPGTPGSATPQSTKSKRSSVKTQDFKNSENNTAINPKKSNNSITKTLTLNNDNDTIDSSCQTRRTDAFKCDDTCISLDTILSDFKKDGTKKRKLGTENQKILTNKRAKKSEGFKCDDSCISLDTVNTTSEILRKFSRTQNNIKPFETKNVAKKKTESFKCDNSCISLETIPTITSETTKKLGVKNKDVDAKALQIIKDQTIEVPKCSPINLQNDDSLITIENIKSNLAEIERLKHFELVTSNLSNESSKSSRRRNKLFRPDPCLSVATMHTVINKNTVKSDIQMAGQHLIKKDIYRVSSVPHSDKSTYTSYDLLRTFINELPDKTFGLKEQTPVLSGRSSIKKKASPILQAIGRITSKHNVAPPEVVTMAMLEIPPIKPGHLSPSEIISQSSIRARRHRRKSSRGSMFHSQSLLNNRIDELPSSEMVANQNESIVEEPQTSITNQADGDNDTVRTSETDGAKKNANEYNEKPISEPNFSKTFICKKYQDTEVSSVDTKTTLDNIRAINENTTSQDTFMSSSKPNGFCSKNSVIRVCNDESMCVHSSSNDDTEKITSITEKSKKRASKCSIISMKINKFLSKKGNNKKLDAESVTSECSKRKSSIKTLKSVISNLKKSDSTKAMEVDEQKEIENNLKKKVYKKTKSALPDKSRHLIKKISSGTLKESVREYGNAKLHASKSTYQSKSVPSFSSEIDSYFSRHSSQDLSVFLSTTRSSDLLTSMTDKSEPLRLIRYQLSNEKFSIENLQQNSQNLKDNSSIIIKTKPFKKELCPVDSPSELDLLKSQNFGPKCKRATSNEYSNTDKSGSFSDDEETVYTRRRLSKKINNLSYKSVGNKQHDRTEESTGIKNHFGEEQVELMLSNVMHSRDLEFDIDESKQPVAIVNYTQYSSEIDDPTIQKQKESEHSDSVKSTYVEILHDDIVKFSDTPTPRTSGGQDRPPRVRQFEKSRKLSPTEIYRTKANRKSVSQVTPQKSSYRKSKPNMSGSSRYMCCSQHRENFCHSKPSHVHRSMSNTPTGVRKKPSPNTKKNKQTKDSLKTSSKSVSLNQKSDTKKSASQKSVPKEKGSSTSSFLRTELSNAAVTTTSEELMTDAERKIKTKLKTVCSNRLVSSPGTTNALGNLDRLNWDAQQYIRGGSDPFGEDNMVEPVETGLFSRLFPVPSTSIMSEKGVKFVDQPHDECLPKCTRSLGALRTATNCIELKKNNTTEMTPKPSLVSKTTNTTPNQCQSRTVGTQVSLTNVHDVCSTSAQISPITPQMRHMSMQCSAVELQDESMGVNNTDLSQAANKSIQNSIASLLCNCIDMYQQTSEKRIPMSEIGIQYSGTINMPRESKQCDYCDSIDVETQYSEQSVADEDGSPQALNIKEIASSSNSEGPTAAGALVVMDCQPKAKKSTFNCPKFLKRRHSAGNCTQPTYKHTLCPGCNISPELISRGNSAVWLESTCEKETDVPSFCADMDCSINKSREPSSISKANCTAALPLMSDQSTDIPSICRENRCPFYFPTSPQLSVSRGNSAMNVPSTCDKATEMSTMGLDTLSCGYFTPYECRPKLLSKGNNSTLVFPQTTDTATDVPSIFADCTCISQCSENNSISNTTEESIDPPSICIQNKCPAYFPNQNNQNNAIPAYPTDNTSSTFSVNSGRLSDNLFICTDSRCGLLNNYGNDRKYNSVSRDNTIIGSFIPPISDKLNSIPSLCAENKCPAHFPNLYKKPNIKSLNILPSITEKLTEPSICSEKHAEQKRINERPCKSKESSSTQIHLEADIPSLCREATFDNKEFRLANQSKKSIFNSYSVSTIDSGSIQENDLPPICDQSRFQNTTQRLPLVSEKATSVQSGFVSPKYQGKNRNLLPTTDNPTRTMLVSNKAIDIPSVCRDARELHYKSKVDNLKTKNLHSVLSKEKETDIPSIDNGSNCSQDNFVSEPMTPDEDSCSPAVQHTSIDAESVYTDTNCSCDRGNKKKSKLLSKIDMKSVSLSNVKKTTNIPAMYADTNSTFANANPKQNNFKEITPKKQIANTQIKACDKEIENALDCIKDNETTTEKHNNPLLKLLLVSDKETEIPSIFTENQSANVNACTNLWINENTKNPGVLSDTKFAVKPSLKKRRSSSVCRFSDKTIDIPLITTKANCLCIPGLEKTSILKNDNHKQSVAHEKGKVVAVNSPSILLESKPGLNLLNGDNISNLNIFIPHSLAGSKSPADLTDFIKHPESIVRSNSRNLLFAREPSLDIPSKCTDSTCPPIHNYNLNEKKTRRISRNNLSALSTERPLELLSINESPKYPGTPKYRKTYPLDNSGMPVIANHYFSGSDKSHRTMSNDSSIPIAALYPRNLSIGSITTPSSLTPLPMEFTEITSKTAVHSYLKIPGIRESNSTCSLRMTGSDIVQQETLNLDPKTQAMYKDITAKLEAEYFVNYEKCIRGLKKKVEILKQKLDTINGHSRSDSNVVYTRKRETDDLTTIHSRKINENESTINNFQVYRVHLNHSSISGNLLANPLQFKHQSSIELFKVSNTTQNISSAAIMSSKMHFIQSSISEYSVFHKFIYLTRTKSEEDELIERETKAKLVGAMLLSPEYQTAKSVDSSFIYNDKDENVTVCNFKPIVHRTPTQYPLVGPLATNSVKPHKENQRLGINDVNKIDSFEFETIDVPSFESGGFNIRDDVSLVNRLKDSKRQIEEKLKDHVKFSVKSSDFKRPKKSISSDSHVTVSNRVSKLNQNIPAFMIKIHPLSRNKEPVSIESLISTIHIDTSDMELRTLYHANENNIRTIPEQKIKKKPKTTKPPPFILNHNPLSRNSTDKIPKSMGKSKVPEDTPNK